MSNLPSPIKLYYSYIVYGLIPTYLIFSVSSARSFNPLQGAALFLFFLDPESNFFFVAELMDYPDSDEDAGGQSLGVNPSILDAEDIDVAQDSSDKPDPEGGASNKPKQQGGSEWKSPSIASRSSYYTDGTPSSGRQSPPLSFSPHTIHMCFSLVFVTEQKRVFILQTPREREILDA